MNDIHADIVAGLVAELEAGVLPWRKPWSTESGPRGLPVNAVTGRAYSGVNILLLWHAAAEQGFATDRWLTFRQAKAMGGVRKGERGTRIVFAKSFVPEEERRRIGAGEIGEEQARRVWCLRRYCVFNTAQVREPERVEGPTVPASAPEAFIAAVGADIRHGGTEAYYNRTADRVQLPEASRFEGPEQYAATALHELAHWSGHPSRLDRAMCGNPRDEAYALEELVAELAAAFLCAGFRIAPADGQHASYLAYWLDAIRRDARYLFSAARQASAAARFLESRVARTQASAEVLALAA